MKKLIVIASLLSVSAAHADTSNYGWRRKGVGTDTQLNAAAEVCDQRCRAVMNGAPTSASYRRCMLQQGWHCQGTVRDRYFIDPDTGERCRHAGWATICE